MYQLLEKWVATCSWKRSTHMYTLSPRMHLLLGSESTHNQCQYVASIAHRFASVVGWAKLSKHVQSSWAKAKAKTFVTSLCICASFISLGTAATGLRTHWMFLVRVCRNRSWRHCCTALESTTESVWRGYEATLLVLSYGEITTSSNTAPQQDARKFKLGAIILW